MDFFMGLRGRDFVMVCSDTSAVNQIIAIKDDEEKIVPVDSHKLFVLSGEPGDRVQFSEYIVANAKLYRYAPRASPRARARYGQSPDRVSGFSLRMSARLDRHLPPSCPGAPRGGRKGPDAALGELRRGGGVCPPRAPRISIFVPNAARGRGIERRGGPSRSRRAPFGLVPRHGSWPPRPTLRRCERRRRSWIRRLRRRGGAGRPAVRPPAPAGLRRLPLPSSPAAPRSPHLGHSLPSGCSLRNSTKLSTKALANFTRAELAGALRSRPYFVNLLIAGWDDDEGEGAVGAKC